MSLRRRLSIVEGRARGGGDLRWIAMREPHGINGPILALVRPSGEAVLVLPHNGRDPLGDIANA
jgi:hypothetical protein